MTRTNIGPATDSAALRQMLRSIDITVPLRTKGRKTHHTERWAICRLLSTLDQHQRLAFPLSTTHRDKPDFLVTQGSLQVGVEATEAISEQYAAFSALAEHEFPDVLLEPSHFKWGSPPMTLEEMREILRQGRLTGSPWVGDRPEKEWALYMDSVIRAKLEKFKQADYVKFDETWLAIYNNLPLPHVDLQRAVARLRPMIQDVWNQSPTFQRIYIEHGPVIVEIRKDGGEHLVVEDLWSWSNTTVRAVTKKTALWDPAKQPRARVKYVDVSAVSNERLEIVQPATIEGRSAPSRARKVVEVGDSLFATIRPALKRVAQVPKSLHGEIASTAFCVLRPDRDQIDPDFLFFSIAEDNFVAGVAGLETGASYPAVRDQDVLDQAITLPPIGEQRNIAAALRVVSKQLANETKAVNLALHLKLATMRQLFTRGLRGEPRKDTEIGAIPNGWRPTSIGDVALNAQYGLSVRGQATGRYPILRMNCQEDGHVIFRDLQYVDLDDKRFKAFKLADGDLLFNRTNSIEHVGRTAIFMCEQDAVFASYLIRLSVDAERCRPGFLNYYMNMSSTQADIKKLASRAVGQANINATKLRTVVFPLPPSVEEQDEIVSVLEAIDRKIELHRQKRAVLENLFKSLLHKLMTGEIRASDLNLSAIKQSEAVAA